MWTSTTIPPRPSSRRPRWPMPRRATTPWPYSSATMSPSACRSWSMRRTPTSSRPTSCRSRRPEGLLGATDFLKRRVSLPFRGNFAEFRHTLRHEMVHVFQLDLLSEAYLQSPRHRRFDFPLWWTEGLAELWSGGQDARDEMVMRDLTLSGRLPALRQLTYVTSGIVYPIGGQIQRWLADTYGDWRVTTMYKEQNRHDTFEAAIRGVYGRHARAAERRVPARHAPALLPVGGQPRAADRAGARGGQARGQADLPACHGQQRRAKWPTSQPGNRIRHDLPPRARQRPDPHHRHRRSERGDGVVPPVRFPDGRVAARPPALHRAVRRSRRGDRVGPGEARRAGPLSVPRAGVAALAAVDARRSEHRA